MSGRVQDKVAVVTGAASGIGAAAVARFAAEGAKVVLCDIDGDGLAARGRDLGDRGFPYRTVTSDVSVRSDCEAVVEAACSVFGGLDLLVNSAGITRRNLPEDEDFEWAWERVMAVNLKGTLLMCHAALPAMRERGGGAIVNLASVMGQRGYPPELGLSDGFNPYPHSKGGVIQLTRDLGLKLALEGVRVNVVCPAFVHTALTEGITASPERHRLLADRHPMGRLGRAEEIANVILFLASDEASFVTAAAWSVDGGYTAA